MPTVDPHTNLFGCIRDLGVQIVDFDDNGLVLSCVVDLAGVT